jgi:hypothetical protein
MFHLLIGHPSMINLPMLNLPIIKLPVINLLMIESPFNFVKSGFIKILIKDI